MTHIIHVPNLKERTTTFIVESDLDFISGPSEVTIGEFIALLGTLSVAGSVLQFYLIM
jgi:hypothetical protein